MLTDEGQKCWWMVYSQGVKQMRCFSYLVYHMRFHSIFHMRWINHVSWPSLMKNLDSSSQPLLKTLAWHSDKQQALRNTKLICLSTNIFKQIFVKNNEAISSMAWKLQVTASCAQHTLQLMLLGPQAVQLCALRAASHMQCVHAHLTEPEQGCCLAPQLQHTQHTPGCQVMQSRLVLPV